MLFHYRGYDGKLDAEVSGERKGQLKFSYNGQPVLDLLYKSTPVEPGGKVTLSKTTQLREWISRRLPILIAIGVASLSVVLWQALIEREHTQIQFAVEQQAIILQSEIIERIEPKILALVRMAKRWEIRGGTPREEWEIDATLSVVDQPGLRGIAWTDPSYILRWVPRLEGRRIYIGRNTGRNELLRAALEEARESREMQVTRSIELFDGDMGFMVFVPLFVGERFDGYIVGIFRILESLDPLLSEHASLGYSIALFDGEEEIANSSDASRQEHPAWLEETSVEIRNVTWRVQVWAGPELLANMRSSLPEVVLATGLLLALLLAFTARLVQTAKLHARDVGLANQGLEQQITERKQTEEELREAHESLSVSLDQLEFRNHEISQLSKMTDLLQSCYIMEEAYALISQFAQELFPSATGGVYLLNPSRKIAESVAVWGKSLSEDVFAVEACWAIRSGKAYCVKDDRSACLCSHLKEAPSAGYFCIPMMGGGEIYAILHLRNYRDGNSQPEVPRKQSLERQQQLAMSFADRAGMALANLKLREELRIQSIRDPLTNLFNRRYLEESLECALARATRKKSSVGVIMLDIDHFKFFNDTFGHDAGDTILREIGHFLQAHVRKEDVACRYGGEEFTFIMSESSVDSVMMRAEYLRMEVKILDVRHAGQLLGPINFSVGVAVSPEHGLTAKDLLKAADIALLCAKREGRDRTVVGLPAMQASRQTS